MCGVGGCVGWASVWCRDVEGECVGWVSVWCRDVEGEGWQPLQAGVDNS